MPDPALEQTGVEPQYRQQWRDAVLAIDLLAAYPGNNLSVRLRGAASPARERWLQLLKERLEENREPVRLPPNTPVESLLSGVDVVASLLSGRICQRRGLLERVAGSPLLVPMAERLEAPVATMLAKALEQEVRGGRDLPLQSSPVSLIALDEAVSDHHQLPTVLADRLMIDIRLDGIDLATVESGATCIPASLALAPVPALVSPDIEEKIALLALAFGAASLRKHLHISSLAKLVAGLDGNPDVDEQHVISAARLVLGVLPEPECVDVSEENVTDPSPPEPADNTCDTDTSSENTGDRPLDDLLVAALAANPDVVGALTKDDKHKAARNARSGKSGNRTLKSTRGRPVGLTPRAPHAAARPNVAATLRAAIPKQRIRNPEALHKGWSPDLGLRVMPQDFRYIRYKHRTESTAIFAVDASGSTALARLAEAKGAVELLLADCYVRRDSVALVAFRGKVAETLLEPTRSLVRAKRSLSALPGGGATPLANGILRSLELAEHARQRGQTPLVVYLTDGRGNVTLSGEIDRKAATEDAERLARRGALHGIRSILIDIAARPKPSAQALANAMEADYCPLPHVTATAVSGLVSWYIRKPA
ncbi:VWA domain-containing protein [Roseibium sp. RKSG952]|uniref:VWA domain-containing protein n=1 Tax=Roseibium sp. RKSG952 TaxID=2529384 RepID=UPI0018AD11CA|nr:VWA domain-containing protein [Roseibium sp. RKSG952]